MQLPLLNIFLGASPPDEFFEDAKAFKECDPEIRSSLIERSIEWYPRDNIESEWESWTKDIDKQEISRRKSCLRFLLFIERKLANESISLEEARQDFRLLEIPLELLQSLHDQLRSHPEFRARSVKSMKPAETTLTGIDWRIDSRTYRDETTKTVIVLELERTVSSEKEPSTICFDLTPMALTHLISVLARIEQALGTK